jgi:2,3-diaminopropionate biosynthesis protein SbnA
MVQVGMVLAGRTRRVRLKLESANPWGSSKDRTAVGLLDALEATDDLWPGATVVESSSGNLGVALAALARDRGYRFVAVVDPRVSQANLREMRELGARLELADEPDRQGGYLLARLRRVQELVCDEGYFWTNQYGNPANPAIHYEETAPELWRQTSESCEAVFVAVSTGGTLAGVSRYLREVDPLVHVVAVDVVGSVALGGAPGTRLLTGIGSARKSEFLDADDYDSSILVTTENAVGHCRALLTATGLSVGGSSGAVLAACASFLATHPDCETALCICPDGGRKYLDTIYRDAWLREHGVRATEAIDYGRDVRALSLPQPR